MKLTKSNLAKKLIIVLIALMVFNIAVPQQVKAWDVAGILMKPLCQAILGILVNIDVTLGAFLAGVDSGLGVITGLVDILMDKDYAEGFAEIGDSLSLIFIGPDAIFSGKVESLNANIFDYLELDSLPLGEAIDWGEGVDRVSHEIKQAVMGLTIGDSKVALYANAVAKLYITLRNICALVMLAGLIYTGIRILLSANVPTKRGVYLNILQDWLIGMVLLVFSHLIMILVFKMSDALTRALGQYLNGMGGLNLKLILTCVVSFDSAQQIICLAMLGYMIWLTVIFAISYGKRFFWVCLLIIVAPVFSVLYAFGQQAKSMYSRWLKEYITIVLIQPFHMLVYSTLIAIPMSLGGSDFNIFAMNFDEIDVGRINLTGIGYSLGAMAMIRPAEKYLRSLLGMDQGIASVASYDSGKQTFDAIKKTVTSIAKTVVAAAGAVALTVGTGGAGAGAGAALIKGAVSKGATAKIASGTKFLAKRRWWRKSR